MNKITTIILLFVSSVTYSQVADTSVIRKIREEAFEHSGVAEFARQLTDVAGPRLTNSPGYNRAASYVINTFNNLKLDKAAKESWGHFGKGWSNDKALLSLTAPYHEQLIGYPVAWTKGTVGPSKQASVIMLDALDSAIITAKKAEIKGKIVILRSRQLDIPSPFTQFAMRHSDSMLANLQDEYMIEAKDIAPYLTEFVKLYHTILYLEQAGAVALIRKSNFRDGTVDVQGSVGYSKTFKAILPEIMLASEQFLKVQRMLDEGQPVKMEIDIKNSWDSDHTDGYNVIGEIKGSDPKLKEQVVMLGGHLDSWHSGTGATDNAAGCVVMMEAIRIIKSLGISPRRTIRIALWGGEEQGLLGSFGYVKKHFGDPKNMQLTEEQKKVSVYFNLDNGTGKIRGVFAQHNQEAATLFQSWLTPFADLGATTVTLKNTGSTDHLSFDAVGIPGFQFVQDPIEYETRTHHTNMDVYDHLSIEDLKQASAVVAAFVYNAAMQDAMIPRKELPKPERFVFDLDIPF